MPAKGGPYRFLITANHHCPNPARPTMKNAFENLAREMHDEFSNKLSDIVAKWYPYYGNI
jgi:hypothetical protein